MYNLLLKGISFFLLFELIPNGFLMFPLKIDKRSDNNDEEVDAKQNKYVRHDLLQHALVSP